MYVLRVLGVADLVFARIKMFEGLSEALVCMQCNELFELKFEDICPKYTRSINRRREGHNGVSLRGAQSVLG